MLIGSRMFAVHKAEASRYRFMKEWVVMMAIVVHVDDMFRV